MAQVVAVEDDTPLLLPVSAEAYAAHWPNVEKQLLSIRHLWQPWWTLEYLQSPHEHNMQVWAVRTGCNARLFIYTQIIPMPAVQVLQVVLIFGNSFDRLWPIIEASFTKIAHDWGCKEVEIVGRRGWGRKLKAREVATVFRIPVPQIGVH